MTTAKDYADLGVHTKWHGGCSADTQLVLGGTPKRWRRELVILTPVGTHIW